MTEFFKKRKKAFISILCVVFLGLLSRKIAGIPLFIGDILYALMMYYIVCFFRGNRDRFNASIALGICFMIEFSQLITWDVLVEIRGTLIGHLILGQGFLFSDLICYVIGCFMGIGLGKIEGKRGKKFDETYSTR